MKLELVKDWMTRDVVTITPEKSIAAAYQVMLERKIRRLPVVGENGRLLGIITSSDCRSARPPVNDSANFNHTLAHLTITEIMSTDPITVSENATIGQAADLMLQHTISGLPVLDNNEQLVGIITESDIFRMVVHDWQRSQRGNPAAYAHYGRQ